MAFVANIQKSRQELGKLTLVEKVNHPNKHVSIFDYFTQFFYSFVKV